MICLDLKKNKSHKTSIMIWLYYCIIAVFTIIIHKVFLGKMAQIFMGFN